MVSISVKELLRPIIVVQIVRRGAAGKPDGWRHRPAIKRIPKKRVAAVRALKKQHIAAGPDIGAAVQTAPSDAPDVRRPEPVRPVRPCKRAAMYLLVRTGLGRSRTRPIVIINN